MNPPNLSDVGPLPAQVGKMYRESFAKSLALAILSFSQSRIFSPAYRNGLCFTQLPKAD
jgi:hypothetical protein